MNKKEAYLFLVFGFLLVLAILLGGCDEKAKTPDYVQKCINADEPKDIADGSKHFLCLPAGFASCLTDPDPATGLRFCTQDKSDHVINTALDAISGEETSLQEVQDAIEAGDLDALGYPDPDSEDEEEIAVLEKNVNSALDALEQMKIAGKIANLDINKIYTWDNENFFMIICNEDTKDYWFEWREEENSQENLLFICKRDLNGVLKWQGLSTITNEMNDKDEDGVPRWFDCDEFDKNVYGNFMRYGGPDQKIICGDGKENACGVLIDETDDCNKNAYACLNDCRAAGESCTWIEGETENNCCGGKGLEDIGKTEKGDTNKGMLETEFICLPKKNTQLIGTELSEVPGGQMSVGEDAGGQTGFCNGDWCWVKSTASPELEGGKFTVFTVRDPKQKPYDIVSNGEEWQVCSENYNEAYLDVPAPGLNEDQEGIGVTQAKANRFQCYKEGDHYSWAECVEENDASNNNGVKVRFKGEGLFSFPLGEGIEPEIQSYNGMLDILSESGYEDFYGDNHKLDFANYDQLNLMVKFCEGSCSDAETYSLDRLHQKGLLPLELHLTIRGYGDKILFQKNILGQITNGLSLGKDSWAHIIVNLKENISGVESLVFETKKDEVEFRMRNLYLSKEDENEVAICSGQDSSNRPAWLKDIDEGESDIDGSDVCSTLYGTNAWLGDDTEIDPNYLMKANCCGDDPQEYYAKESKTDSNGNQFGCWNSNVLGNEETAMNVEFNVEYQEKEYILKDDAIVDLNVEYSYDVVDYKPAEVEFMCSAENFELPEEDLELGYQECYHLVINDGCTNQGSTVADGNCWVEYSYTACIKATNELCSSANTCKTGTATISLDCDQPSEEIDHIFGEDEEVTLSNMQNHETFYVNGTSTVYEVYKESNTPEYSFTISLAETPKFVKDISILKPKKFQKQYEYYDQIKRDYSLTLNPLNSKVEVYFYDPLQGIRYDELKPSDIVYDNSTIYIMADLTEEYQTETEQIYFPGNKNFSYACTEAECLYPLPGDHNVGVTITNPHPELYDLYFVTLNEATKEIEEQYIGKKREFYKPGNVIARKVSQQIIYQADGIESQFYGCEPANYLLNISNISVFLTPQDYCSIQGESFCSPSVVVQEELEQYTLVNSWSTEEIIKVGYLNNYTDGFEDLETYFETLFLQLKEPFKVFEPEERNHTTSVVPFRNIMPNAEFRHPGAQIPHWELFKNKKVVKNEQEYFENNGIKKLAGSEILRSEKIAVKLNTTYYFWQNGTADVVIFDDEGEEITVYDNGTFQPNSQFITFQFKKGTIVQPFLQLVDDLGIGEYDFEHRDYPDEFDFRSGLACCPTDYCWNGYTCVEPMDDFALITEHFGVGKDYRCINGDWTHLPIKHDWNNKKWGFCSEEDQCFVSSSSEATAENTAEDFYDGNFPICINSGETILDHYCQDGSWTTRTKFLASKLTEFADTDDFVLYCTNYKDALLDYGNENYLGGESLDEVEPSFLLGEAIVEEEDNELSYNCFPEVMTEEGKELVPQEENTCINNMCVLRYKEGGKFKTAFATTLNKNITDANSFLLTFDIAQQDLPTVCAGEDTFVKCDIEGPANLWYSEQYNAVIYSKEGIQLGGSWGDQIVDWFKDLFGLESSLSEEETFVTEAQNFNEVYLLNKNGKKVFALKELFPGKAQTLIAEYENFQTPVCDYIDNIELPEELKIELLEEISGMEKHNCTVNNGKYRVEMVAGIDYFWPQLTGKLRVAGIDK
jgi:hypothetical protein